VKQTTILYVISAVLAIALIVVSVAYVQQAKTQPEAVVQRQPRMKSWAEYNACIASGYLTTPKGGNTCFVYRPGP